MVFNGMETYQISKVVEFFQCSVLNLQQMTFSVQVPLLHHQVHGSALMCSDDEIPRRPLL